MVNRQDLAMKHLAVPAGIWTVPIAALVAVPAVELVAVLVPQAELLAHYTLSARMALRHKHLTRYTICPRILC